VLFDVSDPRDRAILLAFVEAVSLLLAEAERALREHEDAQQAPPPPGGPRRCHLRLIRGGRR
jgi:hypothetical protein